MITLIKEIQEAWGNRGTVLITFTQVKIMQQEFMTKNPKGIKGSIDGYTIKKHLSNGDVIAEYFISIGD